MIVKLVLDEIATFNSGGPSVESVAVRGKVLGLGSRWVGVVEIVPGAMVAVGRIGSQ